MQSSSAPIKRVTGSRGRHERGSCGFAPISFPLFHGVHFGGGRIELSSFMVILLELSEDDMVRRMSNALN